MPLIEDQHVIQALSAKRAKESFRVGVRLRRPDRRLDDPRAVPGEDGIKCRGELAVPVADQERDPAGALAGVHQEGAGLPRGPGPGRIRGDACHVHGPGPELQHEQDVPRALQQHGNWSGQW